LCVLEIRAPNIAAVVNSRVMLNFSTVSTDANVILSRTRLDETIDLLYTTKGNCRNCTASFPEPGVITVTVDSVQMSDASVYTWTEYDPQSSKSRRAFFRIAVCGKWCHLLFNAQYCVCPFCALCQRINKSGARKSNQFDTL